MQKLKKSVSVLLTLMMVLGMFTIVPFNAGAATQSGTNGNITWTFDDETGTLTISGTGEMRDYKNGSAPWYDYVDSIRSVVVEEGITYIGSLTFRDIGRTGRFIPTVELPSTLTEIGELAFFSSYFNEINLPEGLVSIGESAFMDCRATESVTFPSTLESIGINAFSGCESLGGISLPASLKSIGYSAFSDCNLKSITLPLSLESVEDSAFSYNPLETVRILGDPEFGGNVFSNNTAQSTEYYFETARQFSYIEFSNCRETDTVYLPYGGTYLNNGEVVPLTKDNASEVFGSAGVAFGEITWTFDDETGTLTISGTGKMRDYTNGRAPWYDYVDSIRSVVVEEGITYIGSLTFRDIGRTGRFIPTVELPSTLTEIGEFAFFSSYFNEINLPEGLVSIGESAFMDCRATESVTFPSTLESIGINAFSGCESLGSISLPASLKSIGYSAFSDCNLKSITLPLSLESVEDSAFYYNPLETVRIMGNPEIGVNVFSNNTAQSTEYYIETAIQLDYFEFANCREKDTVYLPSGSTYRDNGEIIPITVQNAQSLFGDAKVIITPVIAGHSISLNGDIAMNYYINGVEGEQLHFEWYNKTYDHTVTAEDYDAASGYYKVTVNVAAAEMSCPITATCSFNDNVLETETYSVRQYADIILDTESDFSKGYIASSGAGKYALLTDLIKKMLDYGAKAQTRFGVTDYELANSGVDYTMQPITANHIKTQKTDMTKDLDRAGLNYVGTSIVFLSQTTLRHYYVISDARLFEQAKETANFTFVDKGQRICFEQKNIAAAQLDVAQIFRLGDTTYNYAVLDYCKLVLADESKPQSDRELAMATYWYNDAAKAYFYANDEYEDDMV